MSYKFTDSTSTVVSDGNGWSGLLTAPEVQEWLAAGNTPEPADPLPEPAPVLDPLDKLKAFLAANPDVAALLA